MKKPLDNQMTIISGVIFLLAIIFVLVTDVGKTNTLPKVTKIDYTFVKNLISDINDNYTVNITNDNNESIFNYYTDGNNKLYEIDNKNYVVMNNVTYLLKDDISLVKSNLPSIVSEYFYDFDLLFDNMKLCEFDTVENETYCKIKVTDYINNYNNKYNANADNFSVDYLNIKVINSSSTITKMVIDYTPTTEKILDSYQDKKIILTFSDINNNDFSELNSYYGK